MFLKREYILFIIIICCSIYLGNTQSINIDSLLTEIPKKTGEEKIDLLTTISFYYWNKSPDKGIEYGQYALNEAIDIKYEEGEAKALQNLGVNFWAKGIFDKANNYYFKAIKIYEKLGDKSGIKSCLNNIGIIYSKTNKHEKAIENFTKALQIAIELKDYQSELHINNNIGEVYIKLRNYEEALTYLYKNIEISKKNNIDLKISSSLSNIGNCLMELNRPNEAILYFEKAYFGQLSISNKHQAALSANQLGSLYLKIGKYTKAFQYLKEAEELASEAQALEPLNLVQENLTEYYIKTNDFRKALDYKNKYIETKDSLYNRESSEHIAEILAQFESEKKENENELLRKDNTIKELEIDKQINLRNSFIGLFILVLLIAFVLFNRFSVKKKANLELTHKNSLIENQKEELQTINKELNEQYKELKRLNATKDKFFGIIAHDLRSPISSLLQISEMLDENFEELSEDQIQDFFEKFHILVERVFKLLENLLMWSRSQLGKLEIIFKEIELNVLVNDVISLYKEKIKSKNIRFINELPEQIKVRTDENVLQTVFRNLISNAIKFTNTGGTITISLKNENDLSLKTDKYIILITDSGVGIPTDKIDKLFSIDNNYTTIGTGDEKGTGLGLNLCKELIEKTGESIWVESIEGEGSIFSFSVLKPENE